MKFGIALGADKCCQKFNTKCIFSFQLFPFVAILITYVRHTLYESNKKYMTMHWK